MTKTLAQLKRDIARGVNIEYVQNEQRIYSEPDRGHVGPWHIMPIPEKRRGLRYVSHTNTTGFYLKRPEDYTVKGLFCPWPKASDVEYTDDTFIITDRAKNGQPYQMRTYKIVKYN